MTKYAPDKGFFYTGGMFVDSINVSSNPDEGDYIIDCRPGGRLSLTADMANVVLVKFAEALFDSGKIDMAVADRVAYLMHAVLADREMPVGPHIDYRHLADGWAAMPIEEV